MQKYTLESLKPLNAFLDGRNRLEQSDVDIVNRHIGLIEGTRKETPCPGDVIEYTDEYGDYYKNAHIQEVDAGTSQLTVSCIPHVPFVFKDDEHGVRFDTGGGPWVSADAAALKHIGKREKLFILFGHDRATGDSGVYYHATVNAWECVAPNQRRPGYSTKNWEKQYIRYIEKPADGSAYHYYGQGVIFRTHAEFRQWKDTYRAVEFPVALPDSTVLFLYRETCRLISREEWDSLDFPLDTRLVNGIIHVKVDYDYDAHMITEYRFTNSGYLDPRRFGSYERARGTALVPPGPEAEEHF